MKQNNKHPARSHFFPGISWFPLAGQILICAREQKAAMFESAQKRTSFAAREKQNLGTCLEIGYSLDFLLLPITIGMVKGKVK